MNLKILSSVVLSIGLAGCGGLSDTTSQSFRLFPPKPANVQVNNAAWLVGHGPYADDCWQFGWGCAPPGVPSNIYVGGPNPNPSMPVFVAGPYARPSAVHRAHPRHPQLKLRARPVVKG